MPNELEELKQKLSLFENDASKRGFYTLNRIVNQQIDFLNKFQISTKIASDDKAIQIEYKNAKELWEGLPKLISSLNEIREKMGIDPKEEDEVNIPKIVPVNPQSISKMAISK